MKVSVITPTLNRAHFIKDAMDSVLWQTHSELEYIVIDGGSTDGTLDLLDEYKGKFRQVGKEMKYISEKDNGLYDAMNKGIAMASGEVVGILNSDDFFNSEDCIATIAESFADSDTEAVYADSYYVEANDVFRPVRCYSNKHFKPKWLLYGYIPDHETFYMKKECYEKYGYIKPDYNRGGDFELLLRMLYIEKVKARYIDKVMLTNRIGGVSTSGGLKMYIKRTEDAMHIYRMHNLKTYRYRQWVRYLYRLWNKLYIPKKYTNAAKEAQIWFAERRKSDFVAP